MKTLDRSKAVVKSSEIVINEDDLNIWDVYETPIPDWKPRKKIKPWGEVTGWCVDIETEGLDPEIHKIELIGMIDEQGNIEIIDCFQSERMGLIQFISIITNVVKDYLATYNGIKAFCGTFELGFDLDFIRIRCERLGLEFPFWQRPELKTFSIAQMYSRPIQYYPLYLNRSKTAVIDLFHQTLAWDFVARKLGDKKGLKKVVVDMKLRKSERVELTYEEMRECVRNGDIDRYKQYLKDDLTDTKLLADFLLPAIWYQQTYLNWNFQALSASGNGSKWNDILKTHYGKGAKTSSNKKITGALTFALPGLHYNCVKLDVESLYPHLMLVYGIRSIKDDEGFILQVINYLLKYRVSLKEKKENKTITNEERNIEGTAKVLLNSAYGALGTTGIDYNDPIAASFVTAYGRAIYKHIFKLIESLGYETKVVQGDCVTAETLLLTKNGYKPIGELAGTTQSILNGDRKWVEVPVKEFPDDQIWEISFKRGKKIQTIRCNKDHKWWIANSTGLIETPTDQIKVGHYVRHNLAPKNVENVDSYNNGVAHGIIFGDGNLKTNQYKLEVCWEKQILATLLAKSKLVDNVFVDISKKGYINITCFAPKNWKKLPNNINDFDYLLGFIRGLLATDGSVAENEGANISGNLQTCEFIEKYSPLVGFYPIRKNICGKKGRKTKIRDKICISKQDTWRVFFSRDSVCKEDLLREQHSNKFIETKKEQYWKIVEVIQTNVLEKTYCVEEPITKRMTLYPGIESGRTDGLIVSLGSGNIEIDAKGYELAQYVNARLPKTESHSLKVKYENDSSGEVIFIPPHEKTGEALRKNYLIFNNKKCVKSKGKYNKRDRSILDKTFQIEFIEVLINKGLSDALDFYYEISQSIRSNQYPTEKLAITESIKKNSKTLVELGLGKPGDRITYWFKKDGKKSIPTISEPYDPEYYLKRLETQLFEVLQYATSTEKINP